MIHLSPPPLQQLDLISADINCVLWDGDFSFVYVRAVTEDEAERWITMIFQHPERIDIYRDEINNLGDQEPLVRPETFTELYSGKGLAIRESHNSNYLNRYLDENPVVEEYDPKVRHIRVDTGWTELHAITNSTLQLLNGAIKPKEGFLNAH